MSVVHRVKHLAAAQYMFASEEIQGEWAALSSSRFGKDAVLVTTANILPFSQMDFFKVFLGGRKNHKEKYEFIKGMHFVT